MLRRSAQISTPRSGEGTGSKKLCWNGKFWSVLEGIDCEACEHALMAVEVSYEEPEQNLDGVFDSSFGFKLFFASNLVSCKPFSSGFGSQLDSSPARHFLYLSLCEFKQAREIVPRKMEMGR
ncbi:hypothetical protein MA16_Dca002992 [Dendrobium catenatum]|uniref:Uncharacterized protein n=1 Tax=Dendrobium catenatum TaxID=906689 RepID=A0A2I0X985_9ASPA|nr:hypothetical protein MA16_Dca002992 [Dendrobium catenatum]